MVVFILSNPNLIDWILIILNMVSIAISLPTSLFIKLENERGRIPRSRYYRDLILSGSHRGRDQ